MSLEQMKLPLSLIRRGRIGELPWPSGCRGCPSPTHTVAVARHGGVRPGSESLKAITKRPLLKHRTSMPMLGFGKTVGGGYDRAGPPSVQRPHEMEPPGSPARKYIRSRPAPRQTHVS